MSNFPFTPEKVGNFCLECCPDPINTSVDSRGGWQSTGWIVEPNQKLKITASGTVYWMGSSYTSGPDGIYHPYCSDLNFLHEAILGRVGNNGTVFLLFNSINLSFTVDNTPALVTVGITFNNVSCYYGFYFDQQSILWITNNGVQSNTFTFV